MPPRWSSANETVRANVAGTYPPAVDGRRLGVAFAEAVHRSPAASSDSAGRRYTTVRAVSRRVSRPFAPHPFSMTWTDGLFAHWPFDPDEIRPHVPEPLELDTFDGRAWVSILPFVLSRAGLRCSPAFARVTAPELNFRTYVRFDGTPGLYFFSVDVGHPVVPRVVAGATRLPAYRAKMDVRTRDDRVEFRSVRDSETERGRFEATYGQDGDRFLAEPGTLDHWLAERRRMYDPVGERVLYAEIAHEPWVLQPADATIHANTLFEESSLPTPDRAPRVRYSERRSITGSVPRWIRGLDDDSDVPPDRLARR